MATMQSRFKIEQRCGQENLKSVVVGVVVGVGGLVGRCVGGLRHFGRGQKITFFPDISTNRGLPTFGETLLRGNSWQKSFFWPLPECLKPPTHLPTPVLRGNSQGG